MPHARSSLSRRPADRTAIMLDDVQRAGLKMTAQRVALVRLFATDESHPTAQVLFERLRPTFPSMSFATVYNTLDALAKVGLSTTLRLGGAARFDPNVTPHHHTVCDACGEVRDVLAAVQEPAGALRLPPTPPRAKPARPAREGPFAVRVVERIYRGTCASCTPAPRPAPATPRGGKHA